MIKIIIVNYNNKKDLLACLASLLKIKIKKEKVEVIVVENSAIGDSVTALKKLFPQVLVLKQKENLGFAGGNNIGIKRALEEEADYIMLLNNDTLMEEHCLQELLKVITKDKNIGIVCPKIYFAPGFEFHKKRYQEKDRGKVIWYAGAEIDWQNILGIHWGVDEVDKGQYKEEKEIEFATGCAMLIKKEVFGKIGLFDWRFFLYLEDLDLSVRVKKAGFKLVFAPKAIVWHKNLGTTSKKSQTRQAYYYSRNRLLFALKHASMKTKIALLKWSLGRFVKGNTWEKKGVLDFYLGKFGKGSYDE